MRRSFVAWLLALLLVFAQQGAVLHGLGHLSHAAAHTGAQLEELNASDGGQCASCDGFAQVANPAGASGNSITLAPSRLAAPGTPCPAFLAAEALNPRSRGPPQV